MTRTYCTLFDKNYLYQGVALYHSLLRHAGDFKLYMLCMDPTAFELLQKMQSSSLIPIHVDELITPEVDALRQRTTHGQFCWACQPLICQFILDRYGADMVTYLESDSLFFSTPEALFDEIGERSVSLVPHNYSPEFDNSATAGKFCVQFNAFRNDARARAVLDSWKASCFQYDKSAPHAYPGQTCLDAWPTQFEGVAVVAHHGAGVAPWNIRGYRLQPGTHPQVDGVPVVFYHYHQYGRFKSGAHELGSYPMTRDVVDCFYRPYVAALREAERAVTELDASFAYRREYPDPSTLVEAATSLSWRQLRSYWQTLKLKLRGRYNKYPEAYFSGPTRERAS